jgi:hypothetical protein
MSMPCRSINPNRGALDRKPNFNLLPETDRLQNQILFSSREARGEKLRRIKRGIRTAYLELLDIGDAVRVSLEAVAELQAAIQNVQHGVLGPEHDLPAPAGAAHHLLLHLLRHRCARWLLLEELELLPLIHPAQTSDPAPNFPKP